MNKHCPYCGIALHGRLVCPLCDTPIARFNPRRSSLVLTLILSDYLLVLAMILRFRAHG